jgi:hypothetical protein
MKNKNIKVINHGLDKYNISLTRCTIWHVLERRNNTRKVTKILQKMLITTDPDILGLLMQLYSQLKRKFLK